LIAAKEFCGVDFRVESLPQLIELKPDFEPPVAAGERGLPSAWDKRLRLDCRRCWVKSFSVVI